jgi:hypothetical protein
MSVVLPLCVYQRLPESNMRLSVCKEEFPRKFYIDSVWQGLAWNYYTFLESGIKPSVVWSLCFFFYIALSEATFSKRIDNVADGGRLVAVRVFASILKIKATYSRYEGKKNFQELRLDIEWPETTRKYDMIAENQTLCFVNFICGFLMV